MGVSNLQVTSLDIQIFPTVGSEFTVGYRDMQAPEQYRSASSDGSSGLQGLAFIQGYKILVTTWPLFGAPEGP